MEGDNRDLEKAGAGVCVGRLVPQGARMSQGRVREQLIARQSQSPRAWDSLFTKCQDRE
jgi:hypothetical protein